MDARLWTFLAVAREGRLTDAARSLNLSPSAVSQHIAALEADFGVALFVRGRRGMRLTAAGERLLTHAEHIEAHWRQAYREARDAQSGADQVHVAASHTVTEYVLPGVLERFRATERGARVHLRLTNTAGVLELVETGQVDLGLTEGPIGHRPLARRRLWRDELGVVMSADHPLAPYPRIAVDQLLASDIILREEGSGTRHVLETALDRLGLHLDPRRVVMELSSLRAIVAMVRHNLGVAVVSSIVLADPRERAGLVFRPIDGLDLRRDIALVQRRDDPPGTAARALITLLEHTPWGVGPETAEMPAPIG